MYDCVADAISGAYQPKGECKPQSPSCSALTVEGSNHITESDVATISTDHVTLRQRKGRPARFQTSEIDHKYYSYFHFNNCSGYARCYRSWPHSYHRHVGNTRISSPVVLDSTKC